jgi:hypothetical protein
VPCLTKLGFVSGTSRYYARKLVAEPCYYRSYVVPGGLASLIKVFGEKYVSEVISKSLVM